MSGYLIYDICTEARQNTYNTPCKMFYIQQCHISANEAPKYCTVADIALYFLWKCLVYILRTDRQQI